MAEEKGITREQAKWIGEMPRIYATVFCSLGYNWTLAVMEGKMSIKERRNKAALWALRYFGGDMLLAKIFINEFAKI